MKIFFLFAIAVIILLATNPSESTDSSVNSNSEPACCHKNKCSQKETSTEPDDFIPFQLSPVHI
jgi:hypothetical protein